MRWGFNWDLAEPADAAEFALKHSRLSPIGIIFRGTFHRRKRPQDRATRDGADADPHGGTPDPADDRSSRITLTKAAHVRLPQARAVLLEGNCEVLSDFTDEEAAQLVTLLTRLISSLDRVANFTAPSRSS